MKQRLFFPLIAKLVFIYFFLSPACGTRSSYAQVKDSLETELDSLVPLLLKEKDVPGVSIAVIRNGKTLFVKGYGLADKGSGRYVTVNTGFQIGSVSKTITAIAVLKLAEDGRINIDDPVEKYLKSWHMPESGYDRNRITIRMILGHTAGLSVAGYHGVFKPGDRMPSVAESLNGYEGSDGALQIINEPGSSFRYSSGGYTLLQLMISDVTGISFTDYVQQKVFDPLGMKNSTYQWSDNLEKNVATPYDESGNAWPHYQFTESASGGVYTTAGDLAKFLEVFFKDHNNNKIITRETITQIITPSIASEGKYGLGCKIFPVNETQKLITHDGANEGWRAAYYIHPPTGDGVVMLVNSDKGGSIGGPIICSVFKRTTVDMSTLCSTIKK